MMRRWLTIAATVIVAHVAHADPSAAKAEALFRQGRELMTAGKFAEACAAFDTSQKLDPATTTLFNQADCREKNGQLATAWGLFVDAERKTRSATDDVGAKLHKVAADRAGKLEGRLSKLTVKVTTPHDGMVIVRGDEVIDSGEWNRALPIDGGTYTMTARIGNRDVWSETVTIANASDTRTVDVVVRHLDVAPRTAAPEHHDDAVVASQPSHEVSHRGALIATIGAGALLGAALGFDLWGNSTDADAVAQNDMNLWNSANTERYVAEGFLVAGLACAGVATYLWLRHDDGEETPRRTARRTFVEPIAAARFAGVGIGGTW